MLLRAFSPKPITAMAVDPPPACVLCGVLCAAECCLEKIRFKLVFGKQRAKVLYAPGGTQADKDKIWGPFSYRFQIIVKVCSCHCNAHFLTAVSCYPAL